MVTKKPCSSEHIPSVNSHKESMHISCSTLQDTRRCSVAGTTRYNGSRQRSFALATVPWDGPPCAAPPAPAAVVKWCRRAAAAEDADDRDAEPAVEEALDTSTECQSSFAAGSRSAATKLSVASTTCSRHVHARRERGERVAEVIKAVGHQVQISSAASNVMRPRPRSRSVLAVERRNGDVCASAALVGVLPPVALCW